MSRPEARATGPTTPHAIASSLLNGPTPVIRAFAVVLVMKAGTTSLSMTLAIAWTVAIAALGSAMSRLTPPMRFMP